MKSTTAATIATTLFASIVLGQYAIDPNSVANYTRQAWCRDQEAQCPLICQDQGASGTTRSNECNPDALTYSCVCDTGLSPNLSEYSQTLPYNICTAWGTQCVANCGGNTECASACQQDHPCGAQNPTRQNTSTLTQSRTTTSGGATGTADSGAVTTDSAGQTLFSGFGGGGSASTTGNNNGGDESSASTMVKVSALSAGQTFGTLVLMGAAALGFAVLL